jgi:predicted TIM-barrel fold metal-dependent hydrolase
VAGDLRKGLEIAAKDKDSDWVQLMTPEGDALFLRRLGLVNVLRELKGLDWRAARRASARDRVVAGTSVPPPADRDGRRALLPCGVRPHGQGSAPL